jgi:hypothetical protein
MSPLFCQAVLIVKTFSQDIPKPTGEVSGVCWALLAACVTGCGIALKFLRDGWNETKAELKEERKANKDLEAQTNVLLSNIAKKKGGSSNDS